MTSTWFITGTSSGIGRELTRQLLERGDRVVATVRRSDALAHLAARHGERLRVMALDVTDTAAVRDTVDRAFADAGRIDVIVSNAGYGLFGAAEELEEARIRHQIDTNLLGSIAVIRAALPHLRAQGGGRVLQVSSEGGQIAYPAFSLYHATKWGIEGFVEAVAQEVAPFGIEFALVEPGPTETGFGAGMALARELSAYDATPAGAMRAALGDGSFGVFGDAARTAAAMVAVAAQAPAPRRLVLGSGAWGRVRAALAERLAAVEAQRDIAYSADMQR